jgi:hypothetical protein
MIGTSSDQQHLDRELRRCFLDTRRFVKEEQRSLYRLLSSSHFQRLVHRHLYCWTLHMMIHMTCLQFKRFSCDSSVFFFCKFCTSMNVIFGPKRLFGSTTPIWTLRLSENFLDHTSSRLTLPVFEAISRNFGGWLLRIDSMFSYSFVPFFYPDSLYFMCPNVYTGYRYSKFHTYINYSTQNMFYRKNIHIIRKTSVINCLIKELMPRIYLYSKIRLLVNTC